MPHAWAGSRQDHDHDHDHEPDQEFQIPPEYELPDMALLQELSERMMIEPDEQFYIDYSKEYFKLLREHIHLKQTMRDFIDDYIACAAYVRKHRENKKR